MTFKENLKKLFGKKKANKLLAILIVLVVVGIGTTLIIVSHASPPYGETSASSGSVTSGASRTTGASGTSYVTFGNNNTTTTTPGCADNPPTTSQNSNYTLAPSTSSAPNPIIFNGSSKPPNTVIIPTSEPNGYGYYETSHIVFNPKTATSPGYLAIKGYPDPSLGASYPGVVGAEIQTTGPYVSSSGGWDVCMALSPSPWFNNKNSAGIRGVNMVLNSWPANGQPWSDGEEDFFEGNPGAPDINIHQVNSCTGQNGDCLNSYQGQYPDSTGANGQPTVADGQPHLYSIRWLPSLGYTDFFDDPTLAASGQIKLNTDLTTATPTATHILSMQMQDSSCGKVGLTNCNTVTVEADIYWVAAYN